MLPSCEKLSESVVDKKVLKYMDNNNIVSRDLEAVCD